MTDNDDGQRGSGPLQELEHAYRKYKKNDEHNPDILRNSLKLALLTELEEVPGPKRAFADVVRQMSNCQDQNKRRRGAAILIRALEIQAVFKHEDQRSVVELLEKALPDVARDLKINVQAQTFERWNSWSAIHGRIETALGDFSSISGSLRDIDASRAAVLKTLALKEARPYQKVYGWELSARAVRSLLESVQTLIAAPDSQFTNRHDICDASARALRQVAAEVDNFSTQHLCRFCDTVETGLEQLYQERRAQMNATLRALVRDSGVLGKAYPLHDERRDVSISIPLINEGPGTALQVEISLSSAQEGVVCESTASLGDIPPGPFATSFPILRDSPKTRLELVLRLSWGAEASDERHSRQYPLFVEAQRSDIDWSSLESEEPYSTGIAEGDQFVGRKAKVKAVAGRLLRSRMQSTYITGQKRIGKTSLAFAVRDYVAAQDPQHQYRFLELEWGAFAQSDPQDTVQALGRQIGEFLMADLENALALAPNAFQGTLAPLIEISRRLNKERPQLRYVVLLDEFDEIHPEMYRFGRLAEAVFSNLRSLSSQRNIALVMIGGEKMPYVMGAQGDQLNQFVREEVTHFSRADEWDELTDLITRPVKGILTLRDEAINEIATQAAGHPYYTKLLCAQVFRDAVRLRDADVTRVEVIRSLSHVVSSLDVNAFAHYWKDGIRADQDQEEAISLSRSRLLAAIGRTLRSGQRVSAESLSSQAAAVGLRREDIQPLLNEFSRRGILREHQNIYQCTVPLFEQWLMEVGASRIIVDTLGDEFAARRQQLEETSYVTSGEIVEVTGRWQSYRGRTIGTDDVRQWIDQVQSNEARRHLFTLLKHLRFVTEMEIREKLRLAATLMTREIPEYVRKSKADRRKDVIVTYVDGPAKSGALYASKFAEENFLSAKGVISPDDFARNAELYEAAVGVAANAVIVIDDIFATGKSISTNLSQFVSENGRFFAERSAFLGIIGLFSTKAGEDRVRTLVKGWSELRCDVRICEHLDDRALAFPARENDVGFWASLEERDRAKALCKELGARIHKRDPLGYGGAGLLLVFPHTVPNNSLPILHTRSDGDPQWRPLFERPVN